MYHDYFYTKDPKPNSPLRVREIYRLLADSTYQVCHPSEEAGRKAFLYTDQGYGQVLCKEGDFHLKAKTALLFSLDEPCFYWTAGNQWDFWWFDFCGDAPCQRGILYHIPENGWFGELCQRAAESLRADTSSVASYLSCLLAFTAESMQNEADLSQELFYRAQALIKENLYHMNVASLAEALSVEPRTLYNSFQRFAGCSPKTYIQDYVMDRGKYLLANTTKSIGEISEEMGFSNQFHFSRVFKDTVGFTPSGYRQQSRLSWKKYW